MFTCLSVRDLSVCQSHCFPASLLDCLPSCQWVFLDIFPFSFFPACSSPLGVENGDTILTADSYISYRYISHAKLNFQDGNKGWCEPLSNKGYLQVKFHEERFITGVATQGSGQDKIGQVLMYKLQFSVDETEWWDYMEDGKVKVMLTTFIHLMHVSLFYYPT